MGSETHSTCRYTIAGFHNSNLISGSPKLFDLIAVCLGIAINGCTQVWNLLQVPIPLMYVQQVALMYIHVEPHPRGHWAHKHLAAIVLTCAGV